MMSSQYVSAGVTPVDPIRNKSVVFVVADAGEMFAALVESEVRLIVISFPLTRKAVPDAPVRKENADVVLAAREYAEEPKRPAPGGQNNVIVSPSNAPVENPKANSSFPVGG